MFRSQKIFAGFLIVLVIVFVSELVYLFYYLPNKSKFSSQNDSQNAISPTPASSIINGSSFIYDERQASINGDLVRQILDEAKKAKLDPTSHLNTLISLSRKPNPDTGRKDSNLTTGDFFQVENIRDTWKARNDVESPVIFPGSVLIKLVLDSNEATPSGIVFNGNSPQEAIPRNIFFGIGEQGKRLYIEVKTKRPEPYVVFDKTFNEKIKGLYILFNKKGKSFLVTDLLLNKIINTDVDKFIEGARLAEGLFPKDLFYLGYVVSPKSKLVISELSFILTK